MDVGCRPVPRRWNGWKRRSTSLFPILGQVVGSATWHHHLEELAPMTAGLAIQATTGLHSLPVSPWAGIGVLAGWGAAALLAGGILLCLRDA